MDLSIQVGGSLKGIGSFVHGGEVDEGMKRRDEWKEGKYRVETAEGRESMQGG